MKKSTIRTLSLLLVLVTLTGCGLNIFSTRQTNPSVEGVLGWGFKPDIGTLAMDASRRLMVIRTEKGEVTADNKWQIGEYCAEPSPDAMVDTASLFSAALAAKLKVPSPQGTLDGAAQAQFIQQIASAMSPLLRRSQGLQWTRDNLSFVCNAHLNRVITKAQYLIFVKWILENSGSLIAAEMNNIPGTTENNNGTKSSFPALLPIPTIPDLVPK
jgi:hypothetical protein